MVELRFLVIFSILLIISCLVCFSYLFFRHEQVLQNMQKYIYIIGRNVQPYFRNSEKKKVFWSFFTFLSIM